MIYEVRWVFVKKIVFQKVTWYWNFYDIVFRVYQGYHKTKLDKSS